MNYHQLAMLSEVQMCETARNQPLSLAVSPIDWSSEVLRRDEKSELSLLFYIFASRNFNKQVSLVSQIMAVEAVVNTHELHGTINLSTNLDQSSNEK